MRFAYSLLYSSLALVACGDDGVKHLPDGPPGAIDSPVNPPDPDAPPTPVTVNLTISGASAAGVKVYFQGPDNSLIATVDTDASGNATAVVPPNSSATVVDPYGFAQPTMFGASPYHYVKTWMGIKPGDTLYLSDPGPGATVNFTITLPTDATASYYYLETTCDYPRYIGATAGVATDVAINLTGCTSPVDAQIVTIDAATFNATKFIYIPDFAFAEGMPATVTGAYTPLVAKDIGYSNLPVDFTQIEGELSYITPKGLLFSYNNYAYNTPAAGAGTVTIPVNPIAGAVPVQSLNPYGVSTYGDHYFLRWGGTEPFTTDFANQVLLDYATNPTYDATTSKVSWTATASGVTPDANVVSMQMYRYADPDAGVVGQDWYWDIAAPFSGADVQFPTLPPEIAIYQPIVADSIYIDEMLSAKSIGGYDALRGRALSLDLQNVRDVAAGATGQLTYVTSFRSKGRTAGAAKKHIWNQRVRGEQVRR